MRLITKFSGTAAALAVFLVGGLALPGAGATGTEGGGDGALFVPVVPCRLFDTRPAPATVGPRPVPLGAGETFTQAVTGANGACTIPVEATAVAMNVTIVDPTATSFLTIWPADATQPTASNLNWVGGAAPTPNKVDVKLSADGKIKVFNNGGSVNVLADVVGYYAGLAAHIHSDVYPASAVSLYDGAEPTYIKGCLTSSTTTGVGRLPIVLPIGARLLSVDVATYDGVNQANYNLGLVKDVENIVRNEPTDLAPAIARGLATANVFHDVITPVVPEFVEQGESFYVGFSGFGVMANGFCNATVTYETSE